MNRARTQQALIEATRELTASHGLVDVTVEDIADRAGVSRRTFFNYFPSIEVALAASINDTITGIAEAFLARPADESPLTAIIRALEEAPFEERLISWVFSVGQCGPDQRTKPPALHLWRHHFEWAAGLIAQRTGADADSLYCTTLAGTVLTVFESAEATWLAERPEVPVGDEDVAIFNTLVREGFKLARDGWPPPSTATSHPTVPPETQR